MKQSVISLSNIKEALLYDFSSEAELVKHIGRLSENFTSKRERLNEYLDNRKMVAAYSCFYLLTNLPKLESALKKINFCLEDYEEYEFFDVGAGPGTFSLALLEMNSEIKIRAIENSNYMVEQGNAFIQKFFPKADFKYISIKEVSEKKKKRVGLFGHSVNEMGADSALKYIKILELDTVLLIEPGTKEFFKEFLKIRDQLKEIFEIKYPCYSSAPCPLKSEDCCHQYLKVKQTAEVERLTQLAQKDRRNLPISLSLFEKEKRAQKEETALIVRVYPPTKFSIEWQICREIDGVNQVNDIQIMLRPFSKKEIKEIKLIDAGHKIFFTPEKTLENKKIRGSLLWP